MQRGFFSSVEERQRDYARKVIDAYIKCKIAPRLVATSWDDSVKPPIRWTPDGVHYQRDVELAVRSALPRGELKSAFWQYVARLAHDLVSHDQPTDRTTNTALTRAGKKFAERELSPIRYFRKARA